MKFYYIALILFCSCSSQGSKKATPVAVEMAQAVMKDVPLYISTIGNVTGFSTIDVRTQVTGQIIAAHVNEGDWVKEGELLFSIDPILYQAALDKAKGTLAKDEAQLELTKKKLERNAELVKKEFISKAIYDELKSNVKAQEGQVAVDVADVQTADINLSRTKIYAFSGGKVGSFNFDPGNIVSPSDQTPLTTIEYIDEVNINFSLPEKLFEKISLLNQEKPLHFEVLITGSEPIGEGQVSFIDNTINKETGTFLLRGRAENPKKLMWPGQFVRVKLILDEQKNAILVPEIAIELSQKGPLIWVVKDDMTVKSVPVELGERDDGWIIINKGLQKGERVVTLGQINLKNGASVFIPEKK